jgi:ribosomal protein L11 methyltransferase
MSWNQITVDVPDNLKDAIVGELADDGVAGFWEESSPRAGSTRLLIYFGAACDLDPVEARIRSLFARSACSAPRLVRSMVQDEDWTGEWKRSYTSFPVGDGFFVIPSWVDIPCPDDRLPIRIDPGQAFGTGTHETTQLTLEALERWVEPNYIVLDVGTGSGILTIASRLLGAERVFACDIDPDAITVARGNMDRNATEHAGTFCGSVDAIRTDSVHLLLGNLTADVIAELFGEFHRVLKPHGLVILSGILTGQREDLLRLLSGRAYLIHEELSRGEWLVLVAEKHVA